MLVASFLLYTLSASLLANILCIFRVPTALHTAWGSLVSIKADHDEYADPLLVAVGDISANHTSCVLTPAVDVCSPENIGPSTAMPST